MSPAPKAADGSQRRPDYGLVARVEELIAVRPAEAVGGFAPGGRVRTHQFGGHRSAFRGRGMEFDEVRAYQAGDDIRTIDWRVTARTGRTHTKLFQEERERPVLLLVDARRAMRFGTRDCFKSVQAARAAAVLTWVALTGGDRVGGVVLTPSRLVAVRPERSRSRILGFLKQVADATGEEPSETDGAGEPALDDALRRLRGVVRPGALVFLVSDFRDFAAAAGRELNRIAAVAQVTNIFVHDRLEAALPAHGRYRMSDGAALATLDADAAAVRAAYARPFAARRAQVELASRQRGMAFIPLETGTDAAAILHPERLAQGGGAGRGPRRVIP